MPYDMSQTKTFFESKAVWGGLLAFVAGAIGLVGYSVTPADQASIVQLVTSLASDVGAVIAIYGRVVASKKIG